MIRRSSKRLPGEDKRGRGVFDCVSILRPGARRRALETLGEIPALHVDIDGKDLVEGLPAIDHKLAGLLLPPSEIRNSGHGRHVRYELKEPIDATDDEAVEQATAILRRLTAYLCGDMAVAHHAALLRRPGTHNTKEGAWIECTPPSLAIVLVTWAPARRPRPAPSQSWPRQGRRQSVTTAGRPERLAECQPAPRP
jgi:hypothetical protein